MIGYKAFDKDMKCRGFQYEVGKTYEMDKNIKLCERGFHFCENIADCYSYYKQADARFAKVEAVGSVIMANVDSKCVTDKIRIIEEIPHDEAVRMSNSGSGNSGNGNSGNWNSGDWNSGNGNSGNWNSGNWNSGNWNSGDWNRSSFNNGCFMTVKPVIMMFDKPTDWTIEYWRISDAYSVMSNCPVEYTDTDWIPSSRMTDKEKADHPDHETIGGYLRVVKHDADRQKWWNKLPDADKAEVKSLPNFDADIFYQCTGIRV